MTWSPGVNWRWTAAVDDGPTLGFQYLLQGPGGAGSRTTDLTLTLTHTLRYSRYFTYLIFILLYTSNSLYFRGKYFYSITLIY